MESYVFRVYPENITKYIMSCLKQMVIIIMVADTSRLVATQLIKCEF